MTGKFDGKLEMKRKFKMKQTHSSGEFEHGPERTLSNGLVQFDLCKVVHHFVVDCHVQPKSSGQHRPELGRLEDFEIVVWFWLYSLENHIFGFYILTRFSREELLQFSRLILNSRD